MNFFNLNNPFFRYAEKVADVIIISFFWLIGSIPIVTIGASTKACYESLRFLFFKEEGSVLSLFWHLYLFRLKKSIFLTIIFETAYLILLVLYLLTYQYCDSSYAGAIFLILFLLSFVVTGMLLYCFLLLQQTDLEIKKQIALSYVLTFKHIFSTIFMVISLFSVIVVGEVLADVFPFILFILPSCFCLLCSIVIEKIAVSNTPEIERVSLSDIRKETNRTAK